MQIAQAGFNAFQSYQDMLPPKPTTIETAETRNRTTVNPADQSTAIQGK
jgi:hypothetical protein